MSITTLEALRQLYASPQERAVKKQIATLDIALCTDERRAPKHGLSAVAALSACS